MIDAVCIGEALVDLLPDRRGRLRDCERFEAHSGGAPANVAVGLARQGLRVAFVGCVGEDEFGYLLARKLAAEGIDARLRHTGRAKTGMWFVSLDEHGDRSFFAPNGADGADKLIAAEDLARVPPSRIVHCGSSAHALPAARPVLVQAVREARARGSRVSFDPNVRAHLWRDLGELRELCAAVFAHCDFVKLSEEECETCAGVADVREALRRLAAFGVRIPCVTLGARGAIALLNGEFVEVPAPRVQVVDTTGAGDGFVAGFLAAGGIDGDTRAALRRGCEVGSRVCTALGAVAGLPRC